MGLLAPWFLAGLAGIALPVYLHLLRQHKTTPRPFSSLMFFEKRVQSSVKHRRLKYRVLLLLRALFLAFLFLAFARPFFTSATAATSRGRVLALLIDDSFSMRQGDRFPRAKNEALAVIRGLGSGDRTQVITFGGPARLLTDLTGDKAKLAAAVEALTPGDGASSYAEATRAVRSLSQTAHSPIVAHLFTDLQKSSAPANFSDLRLPPRTQLVPHAVADRAIRNLAVENVLAPRRIFRAKSGKVQATLVSFSDADVTGQASLLLNGNLIETKIVAIPAGGRAGVEWTGVDAPYGLNRGEVRLSVPGANTDAFPLDNHFYFAVERSDPAPALLVHADADTRTANYFQNALAAANQPAFVLTAARYDELLNLNLNRYAFIVLSDPAPSAVEGRFRNYLENGGNGLILLGHRASGTERSGTPASVARVDNTHPGLRSSEKWDGVRFFRTATLQSDSARTLLALDDGSALLTESARGAGRLMTFASALDNVDNDLPVHALFVPFVQQLTSYLGRAETATGNYVARQVYDLRPETSASNSPIEVTDPDGAHVLSLAESTRVRTLPLDRQGFYEIRRENGRHELAAVNPDRRESDFAILPLETVTLWANTGAGPEGGAPGQISNSETQRNEWWWPVLFAAFALALAESLLGNRHLAVKEGVS